VTVLNNQKKALLRGADAISQQFGISVDSAAGMDTGDTGAFSGASDEDILNEFNRLGQ
jgi:hypothetical protein